jgi:1-deoxy-D-xylulose-5-phosphate reductoisomerase
MADATPEQALQHPTWEMGPKITIDSATMMNKALEVIEAHHLFGLPPEKIEVIVHPQSVVHGFVEFADHSVLAQLGPPDMRTPIQVALTWPDRVSAPSDRLDWTKLAQLDFQPPDGDRFPALKLAYRVMRASPPAPGNQGSTAGAVFNAANEAAVAAFLEHRIRFGRIVGLVEAALDALPPRPLTSLDQVMQADAEARRFVAEALAEEPSPAA